MTLNNQGTVHKSLAPVWPRWVHISSNWQQLAIKQLLEVGSVPSCSSQPPPYSFILWLTSFLIYNFCWLFGLEDLQGPFSSHLLWLCLISLGASDAEQEVGWSEDYGEEAITEPGWELSEVFWDKGPESSSTWWYTQWSSRWDVILGQSWGETRRFYWDQGFRMEDRSHVSWAGQVPGTKAVTDQSQWWCHSGEQLWLVAMKWIL